MTSTPVPVHYHDFKPLTPRRRLMSALLIGLGGSAYGWMIWLLYNQMTGLIPQGQANREVRTNALIGFLVVGTILLTPIAFLLLKLFAHPGHRFNPLRRWLWVIVAVGVVFPLLTVNLSVDQTGLVLPIGLFGLAFGTMILPLLIGLVARWRGAAITLTEDGAFVRTAAEALRGQPGTSYRWSDFDSVALRGSLITFGSNSTPQITTIATANGRRVRFGSPYDNAFVLAQTALVSMGEVMSARLIAEFDRTGRAALGVLTFTPAGVEYGGQAVAWAALKEAQHVGTNIVFYQQDGSQALVVPRQALPNEIVAPLLIVRMHTHVRGA